MATAILSIFGFLVLCHLAFAPVFCLTSKDKPRYADSVLVSTSFGLLFSGLLFQLCVAFDLNRAPVIIGLLLAMSILNLVFFKGRLLTYSKLPTLPIALGYLFLFALYSGATLIASIKSGFGTFPQVFFTIDTPFRLTHVHELLAGSSFPPESLSNNDFFVSPTHFGGPAVVAAVSTVTGLSAHHAYFLFTVPILALGTFSCFTSYTRNLGLKHGYRFIAILALASGTYIADIFLDLFSATPKSIVYSLIGGLGNHHNLDTVRPFGYGWKDSYDIAYQAGFFLLSSIFLVSQSAYLWQKIILSSVGVILCVLIKVDLTITVALFTFFSLLICHPSLFRSRFALLFLGITLGVIFFVFSTTYSHLSFVWEISPGALLDRDSNAVLLLAIEALLILFLIAGFAVSNSTWRIFSPAITIPALLAITLPLLLFNVFKFQMLLNDRDITAEIPLENFFLAGNWILLPVCLAAYWSQHYRSRHRYFLHSFLVLPVFFPLLFIWNEKIKNIYTHAFFPEFVEGYVLNQSLGDVLQHVERSALLVTNDFRYPANNFDRDSLQMSLPALFGHQWYAVNYTYYRSAKGSEEILQRINLQKQILSQDEDTILREARERNWTHYLEHKGINPQAPLRTILPLAENDSYRVYRLSNN